MIKGQVSIDCLKNCDKLKNLHLQTLSGDMQNPICEMGGYRNKVLDSLAQIKRLDGKNIILCRGSEKCGACEWK